MRIRAEVNLKLHPNLQRLQTRSSDNTRQLDTLLHLNNTHRVRSHMLELRRRNMNNSIRNQLTLLAQLHPLNPRPPTTTTYHPRRNHNMTAADTPYRHQFLVCTIPVELLDSWRRQFRHSNHSSVCERWLWPRTLPSCELGQPQHPSPDAYQPVPRAAGRVLQSERSQWRQQGVPSTSTLH